MKKKKLNRKSVWLIGSGDISEHYFKVLKSKNRNITIIGRSKKSCNKLEHKINNYVISGGLEVFLKNNPEVPDYVIVAVNIEELTNVCNRLIKFGVKKILCEKPCSLELKELIALEKKIRKNFVTFSIVYNRRFYETVQNAKKIIKKDGGLLSINFQFNEKIKDIYKKGYSKKVLSRLLIVNSSHLIDLVFFIEDSNLIKLNTFTAGKLAWHKSASIFNGHAKTINGTIISYHANWNSSGRWSLELMTKKSKIILNPLETLTVFNHSGKSKIIKNKKNLDINFKAGFYQMIDLFENNKLKDFCSIQDQIQNIKIYNKIGNYKN